MKFCRRPLILFAACWILLLFACSKNESNPNEIPVVPVNFSIDPNSTVYMELNHIGGWLPLTGGYRGIIVYRSSLTEFKAYERACPYDWQQASAQVRVDTSQITISCPVCKSAFVILDGSPYHGPSPYPLKQYQTAYDGSLLYIYN
jgi:nitrite reductase/ring-hydroxylating ferredoxin subunit